MTTTHLMESPCRRQCRLEPGADPINGICVSCGRTVSEISEWAETTPVERGIIASRARERLRDKGLTATTAPSE